MEAIQLVVGDWRFAAAAVLLGTLIGHFIYRKIPPPGDSGQHVVKMLRAGMAGEVARQAGAAPLELIADAVGARAVGDLNAGLRRQRRHCLFWGVLGSAAALVPVFLYTSLPAIVPSWAFAASGALGVYRTWRLW